MKQSKVPFSAVLMTRSYFQKLTTLSHLVALNIAAAAPNWTSAFLRNKVKAEIWHNDTRVAFRPRVSSTSEQNSENYHSLLGHVTANSLLSLLPALCGREGAEAPGEGRSHRTSTWALLQPGAQHHSWGFYKGRTYGRPLKTQAKAQPRALLEGKVGVWAWGRQGDPPSPLYLCPLACPKALYQPRALPSRSLIKLQNAFLLSRLGCSLNPDWQAPAARSALLLCFNLKVKQPSERKGKFLQATCPG